MSENYRDTWDEERAKEGAWSRIEPMEGHGPPDDDQLVNLAAHELEGVLGRIAYAVDADMLDEEEADVIFADVLKAQKMLEEYDE